MEQGQVLTRSSSQMGFVMEPLVSSYKRGNKCDVGGCRRSGGERHRCRSWRQLVCFFLLARVAAAASDCKRRWLREDNDVACDGNRSGRSSATVFFPVQRRFQRRAVDSARGRASSSSGNGSHYVLAHSWLPVSEKMKFEMAFCSVSHRRRQTVDTENAYGQTPNQLSRSPLPIFPAAMKKRGKRQPAGLGLFRGLRNIPQQYSFL